jgi:superfamily II DNA or RNA helicase
MIAYDDFLKGKRRQSMACGFDAVDINPMLYPWQERIVRWAVGMGRAALFEDCGLGKTPQQLEWARIMHEHTGRGVLIVAPLAVSSQTAREAVKFGIEVTLRRNGDGADGGIDVTNYERLHAFDPDNYSAIVLDESSILKAYDGKMRAQIVEFATSIPYRLACTATPAPNDWMEIGTHAEFLGVMRRVEMLSEFFVHDTSGGTNLWRLKGYAADSFWEWMAGWCVALRNPGDIGEADERFNLPQLNVREHTVASGLPEGYLFATGAQDLRSRRANRRASLNARCAAAQAIAEATEGPFLAWCDLNDESAELTRIIDGAREIRGSDRIEDKEQSLLDFTEGRLRVLVTKPSIAGFGMNWQHCADMAFVGLSDSYEQYYQALRRCWRYGQERTVTATIVIGESEGTVMQNVMRKERQADQMFAGLVGAMRKVSPVAGARPERGHRTVYRTSERMEIPSWIA